MQFCMNTVFPMCFQSVEDEAEQLKKEIDKKNLKEEETSER